MLFARRNSELKSSSEEEKPASMYLIPSTSEPHQSLRYLIKIKTGRYFVRVIIVLFVLLIFYAWTSLTKVLYIRGEVREAFHTLSNEPISRDQCAR